MLIATHLVLFFKPRANDRVAFKLLTAKHFKELRTLPRDNACFCAFARLYAIENLINRWQIKLSTIYFWPYRRQASST
jgi:hypothetical protein